MRVFGYIFYRFFRLLKFESNTDSRAIAASFAMALFFSFNIASVVYLSNVYLKLNIQPKVYLILVFVVLSVINYFIFLHKQSYKTIIALYSDENGSYKFSKISTVIFITYIVLTFLLLAFSELMDAIVGDFRIVFRYLEQKFR